MANIEEIQEYLWQNLIFHDYSLHMHSTHTEKNNSNGYSRIWERGCVTVWFIYTWR